eukprot:6147778-Pyramimonas_sp.AAC.2
MGFLDGSNSYKSRKDKKSPEVEGYLFNFEIWQERLVLGHSGDAMKQNTRESSPSEKRGFRRRGKDDFFDTLSSGVG